MGRELPDEQILCIVPRNSICLPNYFSSPSEIFLLLQLLYLKPIFLNILKVEDHDPENPIFSSMIFLNSVAVGYSPLS
jgi:hypothetical protein